MPDCDDDEHSGNVTPRKPSKSDYVTARQYNGGKLGLPCLLWELGYRGRMAPREWQRALKQPHRRRTSG